VSLRVGSREQAYQLERCNTIAGLQSVSRLHGVLVDNIVRFSLEGVSYDNV
jgi:hypothetical protein